MKFEWNKYVSECALAHIEGAQRVNIGNMYEYTCILCSLRRQD